MKNNINSSENNIIQNDFKAIGKYVVTLIFLKFNI